MTTSKRNNQTSKQTSLKFPLTNPKAKSLVCAKQTAQKIVQKRSTYLIDINSFLVIFFPSKRFHQLRDMKIGYRKNSSKNLVLAKYIWLLKMLQKRL